jgi:hypothetical protein
MIVHPLPVHLRDFVRLPYCTLLHLLPLSVPQLWARAANLHRHVFAARVIRPAPAHPATSLSKNWGLIESPSLLLLWRAIYIVQQLVLKASCTKKDEGTICRVAEKGSILIIRMSLPEVQNSMTFFPSIFHSACITYLFPSLYP